MSESITVPLDGGGSVSALLDAPPGARLLYVLAHGAGAGMRHPFLESMAGALAERGVATLRYEFPYMAEKRKRPDPPAVAEAAVRAAVRAAGGAAPGVPLLAGGKSFGGRMTSGAAAKEPLPGVRGLVFLGFPLHAPGKPGIERAAHLDAVSVPMLFLQGTRDDFARLDLLRPLVQRLGARATLHLVEGGDHSFKVKGRPPGEVLVELADAVAHWADAMLSSRVPNP
jgi:uncharacterized protein